MTDSVQRINPVQLKEKLDAGQVGLLLDVREDWEHSMAAIADSSHIPLAELVDRLQELAFEDEIVVYCHFGQRSYQAGLLLKEAGRLVAVGGPLHSQVSGILLMSGSGKPLWR
jgi:rhodanese-related sulfurtransferase